MVEDDEIAEPGAPIVVRLEETVDHRQAVGLLVGQAGADQPSWATVHRGFAILDHERPDRTLLDHVRKVLLVHLHHSAVRVARAQIAAKQFILLLRRPRLAGGDFEVAVAPKHPAMIGAGLEIGGDDPDRNAGRAIEAARPVGDVLAPAETDPAERVVQLSRMRPGQLREDLPLGLAIQIRARRRRGHEEAWEAEGCAQVDSTNKMVARIFMSRCRPVGKLGFDGTTRIATSRSIAGRPGARDYSMATGWTAKPWS